MATVVVTFLNIKLFYTCKMDAEFKEMKRAKISQREKRWSMTSQLEEIVAELMRPIGDIRRSFDTDLSALLEEYLTEAGLHALGEDVGEAEAGEDRRPPPNFAEAALLLQQSACLYGRKVDYLYQHVLSVSDSLHNSTLEMANVNVEETPTPSTARRRRRDSASGWGGGAQFADVPVEASAGARREAGAARPPPTLPRMYLELEPRVVTAADAPLLDYAGEPIGLLADFHVAWRLQGGLLVDELEVEGAGGGAELRPIPLMELQAALAAHAPPPPSGATPPPMSPLCCSTPLPPSPPCCSTPLPPPASPAPPPPAPPPPSSPAPPPPSSPAPPPPSSPAMPPTLPLAKKKRKRKHSNDNDSPIAVKILISKELRLALGATREFALPGQWVRAERAARAQDVVALRRQLQAAHSLDDDEFRGFDFLSLDKEGFTGWSKLERGPRASTDVDDGFFELSLSPGSDLGCLNDTPPLHAPGAGPAEWEAWQARVVSRAAAAEARGGADVRRLTARLLAALPPADPPLPPPTPWLHVLAATAQDQADVSRLFLATLFLANAGKVEIVRDAPLTLDSFALSVAPAAATPAPAPALDELR